LGQKSWPDPGGAGVRPSGHLRGNDRSQFLGMDWQDHNENAECALLMKLSLELVNRLSFKPDVTGASLHLQLQRELSGRNYFCGLSLKFHLRVATKTLVH
jgi:hypothetical protein